MKNIILSCIITFSLLSAEAQTKKVKHSGKKPNKEAIAKANFNKKESAKKLARETRLNAMLSEDSLRIKTDSVADAAMESERSVYKADGSRIIDSVNKVGYGNLSKQRSEWERAKRNNELIMRAAKLTEYESKQVTFINQNYNEKARSLLTNSSTDLKKQELFNLNEERKNKIKTITGKSKERKLEKERKEYIRKNGADMDSQWVDVAESFEKK